MSVSSVSSQQKREADGEGPECEYIFCFPPSFDMKSYRADFILLLDLSHSLTMTFLSFIE